MLSAVSSQTLSDARIPYASSPITAAPDYTDHIMCIGVKEGFLERLRLTVWMRMGRTPLASYFFFKPLRMAFAAGKSSQSTCKITVFSK